MSCGAFHFSGLSVESYTYALFDNSCPSSFLKRFTMRFYDWDDSNYVWKVNSLHLVTPVRAPRSKSWAYVIYFPVNVIQFPFPVLFPRIALEYPIWTQDAHFLCIKSCYVHKNAHIEFWLDVFVTPTPIRWFIWQHNCMHRQCDCVTIAK